MQTKFAYLDKKPSLVVGLTFGSSAELGNLGNTTEALNLYRCGYALATADSAVGQLVATRQDTSLGINGLTAKLKMAMLTLPKAPPLGLMVG